MKKTCFILVIFITAICLLEVVLRAQMPRCSFVKMFKKCDNADLVYTLNPNTDIDFDGLLFKIPKTKIHISQEGMRGEHYTLEKPAGLRRVAMIGDSILFGWGTEQDDTAAKKLELRLNNGDGTDKYQVINFSIPGYNLHQMVFTLRLKGVHYKPDYVIFTLIENDFCKVIKFLASPLPYPYHSYTARFFVYVLELLNIKEQLKKYAPIDGLKDVLTSLGELKKISQANGFKVLIITAGTSDYLNVAIRKSRELGFMTADFGALLAAKGNDAVIFGDGHPNVLGQSVIADLIYDKLKQEGYVR